MMHYHSGLKVLSTLKFIDHVTYEYYVHPQNRTNTSNSILGVHYKRKSQNMGTVGSWGVEKD